MTSAELAVYLTDALFRLGSEPDDPCRRIAFKGGKWPDAETDNGGCCHEALVSFLAHEIDKAKEQGNVRDE